MVVISLPRDHAVRTARRASSTCCQKAAAGPTCTDVVALMTSEIVTNAVRHGSSPVTLGLRCGPHLVRVEVSDESTAPPVMSAAADDDEGGRGMLIVEALATRWGVRDRSPGKTVWFEVATQP